MAGRRAREQGTIPEATAAVRTYVQEQCRAILRGDAALQDRASSAVVHRTRVAIRRLRSVLRILGREPELDADLRWLAGLLGPIRDGDVVGRRLLDLIAELPAHLVLGPVAREIEETVALDRRAAIERLRVARAEPAYRRTLDAVEAWSHDVPIDAVDPPAAVLRRAERRLRRRLRDAGADPEELHRARKAAKRLRYVAELYADLVPRAPRAARRAKELQTVLGDHQDLIVAAAFLRRLAVEHGAAAGHQGFTYGVLHATCEHRAAVIRSGFDR